MTPSSNQYWHSRGITQEVIERYELDGDDSRVSIPLPDGFHKYRTFPEKKYFHDTGHKSCLYGLEQIKGSFWCILAEGEMDVLRLASVGIPAVSGTAGSGTFLAEWVSQLPTLVFVCYDNDKAGKEGGLKAHRLIPNSRVIQLPAEYKDISDYLQDHSKDEFLELLPLAIVVPSPLEQPVFRRKAKMSATSELERAKNFPIEELLQFKKKKACCIWHSEKTPSLCLSSENKVKCFGCGRSGDAIDVYMTLHNVPFREAIIRLNGLL